jgi:hypothetical protein
MFKDAIERVAHFTRPIHTILRTYAGKQIIPGAATLFFVNEEGYAVTCRHVVELLTASQELAQNYANFRAERQLLRPDGSFKKYLKGLELKYKYAPDTVIQAKNTFVDCVDTMSGFTCSVHPTYDLAIVKFNDYQVPYYQNYAVFKKDTSTILPGEFLCRLGFPFPEFTNYQYNEQTDDIEWTATGAMHSPRFPLEGMVTRFLVEEQRMFGIELSTPGLKGQSGGPLFDQQGLVCGMQFSTKHLHLGFDLMDKDIVVNTSVRKVSDYPFLHLGQCIHVDVIKAFLREMRVNFYEED